MTEVVIAEDQFGREGLYVDGRLVEQGWGPLSVESLAAALGITVLYEDLELESPADDFPGGLS